MTAQMEEVLLHQLRRCSALLLRGLHHSAAPDSRMHHGQGRLLSMLSRQDGISQRELAELMQIRPPSLSEVLDRLEQHGLVERRRNEKDKRMINIFLNERGRRAAMQADMQRQHAAHDLFSALSNEEQHQLSHLLTKISVALETRTGDDHHHRGPHRGHHRHRGEEFPFPERRGPFHGRGRGRPEMGDDHFRDGTSDEEGHGEHSSAHDDHHAFRDEHGRGRGRGPGRGRRRDSGDRH